MREIPRLRASLLPMAAQCRLRFQREATQAAGGLRFSSRNLDRRFLLHHALGDLVENAHAAAERGEGLLADLYHAPPPEGLLAEERWLLSRALDHYVELAADRPGRIVGFDESTFPRYRRVPHSSGRFELSLRLPLCLALPDGTLELRQLAFGRLRAPLDTDWRVLALVVALGKAGHVPLQVAHLDLLNGALTEAEFGWDAVRDAAREIGDAVLDALDDPRPAATPDWWCHDCPHLRSCPAVAQEEPDRVVLLATGEVA